MNRISELEKLNVVIFLKKINSKLVFLKIKKKEDQFWSEMPERFWNLDNHPIYMNALIKTKYKGQNSLRVGFQLTKEQIPNFIESYMGSIILVDE